MASIAAEEVRDYYDLNTKRGFARPSCRVGRGRHQLHVLDLGCGIGNSLIFLASHAVIQGTGVTLSGVQAELAARHVQRAGLAGRVACLIGDFLDLPKTIAPAQLAFSIEAFVHGPDPERYFASAAERVVPGGLLIVCDDFLADRARAAVQPERPSARRRAERLARAIADHGG